MGNARTALFNWLLARGAGGTFVLRIEDTDRERSTRESEAGILNDLRWLGLDWDEGPDIGGAHGPYRQSARLELYRARATELLASRRAYYCFCSPEQLEAERAAAIEAGRPPKYSGRCRQLAEDEVRRRVADGASAAVRFAVPSDRDVSFDDVVRGTVTFRHEVLGDPVLLRSDGRPAYNFAVVVDDIAMRITDVVRGEDHVSNTPRQVLLYEAFGARPPRFAHLSLVLGPDHTPLSKRHGATSVAEFRARGYLPEALTNYLALIGWAPGRGDEVLPIDELVRRFSLEAVGHSAGVFDEEKLAWINRHYLREAAPERLVSLVLPELQRRGYVQQPDRVGLAFLAGLMPIAADSVSRIPEVADRLGFLFAFDAAAALARPDVREVMAEAGAGAVIGALAEELKAAPRLDRETFRDAAARVRQKAGVKGRALFHPIRVALTGAAAGPELDLAIPAIDRGAELPPSAGVSPIVGCRERAAAFVREFAATSRQPRADG